MFILVSQQDKLSSVSPRNLNWAMLIPESEQQPSAAGERVSVFIPQDTVEAEQC
jgi:hypothetical protein